MKVTVLMPVYNAERYLKQSIDSILNQSFKDFEFLIINDGSTDSSVKIIESYKDSRIRLVHNEQNMNLVPSLNRGFELAKGDYIARMDADDIALSQRLKVQVDYLDTNLNIGLCGSWIKYFEGGDTIVENPTDSNIIKCRLLFNNVIAHPTIMVRKALLDKYDLRYTRHLAEDFDLWQRCSFKFPLTNIPEVLLNYRISPGSYSQTYSPKVGVVVNQMFKENLKDLGIQASDEQIEIHKKLGNQITLSNLEEVKLAKKHLIDLLKANKRKKLYPSKEFKEVLSNYWFIAVDKSIITQKEKLKMILSPELFFLNAKNNVVYTLKVLKNKFRR